ncbi:hypothetical protein P7C70_g6283, partial [Phenoliferia sp. Uapishka_3]
MDSKLKTLIVDHIGPNTTKDQVQDLFSPYGLIVDFKEIGADGKKKNEKAKDFSVTIVFGQSAKLVKLCDDWACQKALGSDKITIRNLAAIIEKGDALASTSAGGKLAERRADSSLETVPAISKDPASPLPELTGSISSSLSTLLHHQQRDPEESPYSPFFSSPPPSPHKPFSASLEASPSSTVSSALLPGPAIAENFPTPIAHMPIVRPVASEGDILHLTQTSKISGRLVNEHEAAWDNWWEDQLNQLFEGQFLEQHAKTRALEIRLEALEAMFQGSGATASSQPLSPLAHQSTSNSCLIPSEPSPPFPFRTSAIEDTPYSIIAPPSSVDPLSTPTPANRVGSSIPRKRAREEADDSVDDVRTGLSPGLRSITMEEAAEINTASLHARQLQLEKWLLVLVSSFDTIPIPISKAWKGAKITRLIEEVAKTVVNDALKGNVTVTNTAEMPSDALVLSFQNSQNSSPSYAEFMAGPEE